MSDQPAHKKGMRTFASDFERVKNGSSKTSHSINSKPDIKKASTPIPKPKKETPTINKIPAFHEIEKATKDIDVSDAKNARKSTRKKRHKKGITVDKHVGGGAIITDTKKNSFSLFSESKKSLASWFKNRKKKPAPKIAVSQADRRKGVIQQATTKSGTIFTADNETLKERIKERKRQEQHKLRPPETSWSPYTDAGYELLESGETTAPAPATENVVVEFKKRSVPVPTAQTDPVPVETATIEEVEPVAATPEPATETIPAPAEQSVAVTQEPEPQKQPVTPPEPEPAEQIIPLENNVTTTIEETRVQHSLSTNRLTLYVSAGLALVMVTGFFVWVVMNNQQSPAPTVVPVDGIAKQTIVEIMTVDQTFTTEQLQTFAGLGSYSEIALANSDGELLPAALVFNLITPELPTTLQQHATDVRFIQYETFAPQMVVSIADATSVKGILLMQEDTLATALAPLYGVASDGVFVDQTLAGTDARVLTSDSQTSLTYAIIDNETLVIALTPDTFLEIATLLQN